MFKKIKIAFGFFCRILYMCSDKTWGKDSKLTIEILMSKLRRDENRHTEEENNFLNKSESVFYTQTSGQEERER